MFCVCLVSGDVAVGGGVGGLGPLVAAAPRLARDLGVAQLEVEAALDAAEALQLVQHGVEVSLGLPGVLAERVLLAGEQAPGRVVAEHLHKHFRSGIQDVKADQ